MSNYGRKTSAKVKEIDEVEELLRATEDDMLLKLSVGSHQVSRSSSSSLDQDLIRRFEALKKPSISKTITNVPPLESKKKEGNSDEKDGGDVFARFSALKSGSSSSSSDLMMVSSSSSASEMSKVRSDGGGDGSTSSSHEDEVSKVIQWAIDAARLDPSLSDDDEDELEEESNNEDDDDVSEKESDGDSDIDDVKRKPCKSGSKKKKPSKS